MSNPIVSIMMGSTSDMPIMGKAAELLDHFEIPYKLNALSAHRTPKQAADFAEKAHEQGIKVIIAGAGGAAHLPGVIAALTPCPVIGVPIKSAAFLDGWDALLSIVQMPPGIPVATVGVNAAGNAAILSAQIIAAGDEEMRKKVSLYKQGLEQKIVSANQDLEQEKGKYKFWL